MTSLPQLDTIFLNYDALRPGTWPGDAFRRLSTDFHRNVGTSIMVIFNVNNGLHGGVYVPDPTDWDVASDETTTIPTQDGSVAIIPITPPKVRRPTLTPTPTQPAPASAPGVYPERLLRPLALADITNQQNLPRFASRLLQYTKLTSPVTIVKDACHSPPHYLAAVPSNVNVFHAAFLRLKFTSTDFVRLYKIRVSGPGRRGLYEYIKKANRSPNGWIAHDRNPDWKLINQIFTQKMRKKILGFLSE